MMPSGIAMTNGGDLIVLDQGTCNIQIFSPLGVFKKRFGSKGVEPGKMQTPLGAAVDKDDNIYVAGMSFTMPYLRLAESRLTQSQK